MSETEGTHEFVGHHAFADFYGCKGELDYKEKMEEAISLAIEAADMDEVKTDVVNFKPQGTTAISIITQSSVTIHTWPESDGMLVDAITCGPHDPHKIIETLKEIYQPEKVNEWSVERGEASNEVKRLEEEDRETDVAPIPVRFPDEKTKVTGESVEVKPCEHGHGVFATQDFEEGEAIQTFKAPFVEGDEDPSKDGTALRVGELWWNGPKSGTGEEWANFLDHSDTPNASFFDFDIEKGTGSLIAIQPIGRGDEILIDYGEYAPENLERA